MDKKEGIELKYRPGSTQDSEDIEGHNNSTSFDHTVRGDKSSLAKSKVRHYGAHFVFLWRDGEPVFTIGPHWPFFICMWTVLLIIGSLVNYYVAPAQSGIVRLTALVITLWECLIYLFTALKNPGIVTARDPHDPELEKYVDYPNFCNACKILKDDETYHCFDCDVCIKGYDHHCPWTGKCIGQGNLIPFYTFLFSTVAFIVFCILITVNTL